MLLINKTILICSQILPVDFSIIEMDLAPLRYKQLLGVIPRYLSPTLITPVSGASPQATVLAWHAAATGGMLAGLGHAHAGRLQAGEGMLLVLQQHSMFSSIRFNDLSQLLFL